MSAQFRASPTIPRRRRRDMIREILRLVAGRGDRAARRESGDQADGARAVLVIGGPETQQRLCESILKGLGLAVDVVDVTGEALRLLAQRRYALVLADRRTAGLAGLPVWATGPRLCLIGGKGGAAVVRDTPPHARRLESPLRVLDLVRAAEWAAT